MLKDKISLLIKSDLTPNLFGKLIVPIITIFFIKVLTQISNIQEFNTYILIISFCSWMSTTFYLWIHNTLMQKIKFTDGNEFSPLIIIFSICSILLFLVIYIWITIVNLHTNYIFACYIFLVLTGLYPVLGNLIRLQRRIWDYNIWEILGVLLRYLLGLLFFTFLDSFTGDKIISLFLGISLGLVIQILYELYKKWSFYMHYIENTSIKTGLRESKAWLSFGLPLIIVSWASYGLTVADRFVLNYLSEAVRIGEYGLANNIGLQVISVFFSAITFSVYPKCITMFDKGEDWREYLSRNIKFAIIIGILVIGLIYLGGDKIMFFFIFWEI